MKRNPNTVFWGFKRVFIFLLHQYLNSQKIKYNNHLKILKSIFIKKTVKHNKHKQC